jgi:putative heme-binding domain-containing protein
VKRLGARNDYARATARRLLVERALTADKQGRDYPSISELEALALDSKTPRTKALEALWVLVSIRSLGGDADAGARATPFYANLAKHPDSTFRAWFVRAVGNVRKIEPECARLVASLANDPAPEVRLQVAIAARKIAGFEPLSILLEVLSHSGDDSLIPNIVWQNLHPLLEGREADLADWIVKGKLRKNRGWSEILPLLVERLLATQAPRFDAVAKLVRLEFEAEDADGVRGMLAAIAERIREGQFSTQKVPALRAAFGPLLKDLRTKSALPTAKMSGDERERAALGREAVFLSASLQDPDGVSGAEAILNSQDCPEEVRLGAFQALVTSRDSRVPSWCADLLSRGSRLSRHGRAQVIGTLDVLTSPDVAKLLLVRYSELDPELRSRVLDLLTERPAWVSALLDAIDGKIVPKEAVTLNHLRRLQGIKDPKIVERIRAQWGTIRERRSPERDLIIGQMRNFLLKTPGDAFAGEKVFQRVCGQCHKMYGDGQEVGPDLTGSGRNDFEQLLSNVFDPNLVIGSAYQAATVATTDGRVLTGLLAENSRDRVVLKLQGGKSEALARTEIDELKTNEVSLMPEDVEKQLKPQEIADLFAYVCLDRPPTDPKAKRLPGAPDFSAKPSRER